MNDNKTTRRGFLNLLLGGSAAAAGAGLISGKANAAAQKQLPNIEEYNVYNAALSLDESVENPVEMDSQRILEGVKVDTIEDLRNIVGGVDRGNNISGSFGKFVPAAYLNEGILNLPAQNEEYDLSQLIEEGHSTFNLALLGETNLAIACYPKEQGTELRYIMMEKNSSNMITSQEFFEQLTITSMAATKGGKLAFLAYTPDNLGTLSDSLYGIVIDEENKSYVQEFHMPEGEQVLSARVLADPSQMYNGFHTGFEIITVPYSQTVMPGITPTPTGYSGNNSNPTQQPTPVVTEKPKDDCGYGYCHREKEHGDAPGDNGDNANPGGKPGPGKGGN